MRTQTWDPDALGNFEGVNTDGTNTTRTHNKQNQTTVVGSNNLTYDNNGNLTTDETGRTFTWDAWNRLIKVNGTTRYAYDALTRRVKEGSIDLYYTPSWQMVEERNGSTVVTRNVWSPVYIDALVLRDRDADGNSANGLEERLYVLADANYNVTALVVATSGKVAERYVQDPYGRFDVKDGSWGTRSSSSYAWVYLHQGGRWDATSGLYSFRWRDLSPTLMRWVSVDPIGFESRDVDLYRFEGDRALSMLDPFGLAEWRVSPPSDTIRPLPQNVLGTVECRGGHAVVVLSPQNLPGPDDRCKEKIMECIRRHENDHISRMPKDICKGVKDGWVPSIPIGTPARDRLYAWEELQAYQEEHQCLNELLGSVDDQCRKRVSARLNVVIDIEIALARSVGFRQPGGSSNATGGVPIIPTVPVVVSPPEPRRPSIEPPSPKPDWVFPRSHPTDPECPAFPGGSYRDWQIWRNAPPQPMPTPLPRGGRRAA